MMFIEKGKRQFAVLIDPDKLKIQDVAVFIKSTSKYVDFYLLGGSLLLMNNIDELILEIKKHTKKKIVLFPGNSMQITAKADGMLLLSLVSGRNPDFLIGQHVHAAPLLKQAKLPIIPTAYILIDSGKATTVAYISNTQPIPSDKPELAACTALAGEQLGMQCVYLEAGSGAQNPVSAEMIKTVRKWVHVPLIVGGGIRSMKEAEVAYKAGADVVVVGTSLEINLDFFNPKPE